MSDFVLAILGDSQAGLNFQKGSALLPTNSNERWNGSVYADNIGDGSIAMVNELVALSGGVDTYRIINGATNAGAFTIAAEATNNWQLNAFGGGLLQDFVNDWVAANAFDGTPEPDIFYMYCGGVDAIDGIAENDVLEAIGDLITNLDFVFAKPIRIVLSPLARFELGTATDDDWNAVNSAIRRAADFFPEVFSTSDLTDLILFDGQHIAQSLNGGPNDTIKQGKRAANSVANELGVGSPVVDLPPQVIRVEQQTATEILIGLDQEINFDGLLGSLRFSADDWVSEVTPTETASDGSTIRCIVPALSTSAEIKCRNNYGPDDYNPAVSATAFNARGLPVAWADARTKLFIGLQYQDKSVGNLSAVAGSSNNRALTVPTQRIQIETGERRVKKLGLHGSGTAASALLFLVESTSENFTVSSPVVAETASIAITTLAPYDDDVIEPVILANGKYYGATAMVDSTAYSISRSQLADNGGQSFDLNIDNVGVTDGTVPATYERTVTAVNFGLVIWAEVEYINALVFNISTFSISQPIQQSVSKSVSQPITQPVSS